MFRCNLRLGWFCKKRIILNKLCRKCLGVSWNKNFHFLQQFQQMLKDSANKLFELVIVYKLYRFARNRYDSAINKATLKKNGVKVLSACEQITDTPEGIILESMIESSAEYYSAELSQKVKRGMRESCLKGNAAGIQPVFGYCIVDKKYKIVESEAAIVRKLFADYVSGTSKTGEIYTYYKCAAKKKSAQNCASKAVRKEVIEKAVYKAIIRALQDDNFIREVAQKAAETHNADIEESQELKNTQSSKSRYRQTTCQHYECDLPRNIQSTYAGKND